MKYEKNQSRKHACLTRNDTVFFSRTNSEGTDSLSELALHVQDYENALRQGLYSETFVLRGHDTDHHKHKASITVHRVTVKLEGGGLPLGCLAALVRKMAHARRQLRRLSQSRAWHYREGSYLYL
jgi:hypothetical protein